jgi:hypothetical protein
MKSGPPTHKGRRSAYTLAETLAALLFLAIVIPAAVEALHIAGRAGTVAARRGVAARIAAGVLTESILYTNQNSGSQNGTVSEGPIDYHWTLTRETWIQQAVPLLTAEVRFSAQGQESLVRVSTLGNPNTNVAVSLNR